MSWFSAFFKHKGSKQQAQDQLSFFIREAQNSTIEMGGLLKQIADAGHADISQQCDRLLMLNARIGNTLEQVQKSLG